MKITFKLFLLTFTFISCLSFPTVSGKDKVYWYNRNYELIQQKIAYSNLRPENLLRVKNVILFVGDGMGLTTVTASRVYKRQKSKNPDAKLVFDDFPSSALIHTDTANSQISESAAAATALFCGVKTNLENLGVDATAPKNACNNVETHTPSIISWAQNQNLKTGFVTTARVTHATPAALYAHSRRHMEDDSKSDVTCKDIARQLIENEPGKNFNVILGGGMRSFISNQDPHGRRKDDRNLTDEWMTEHPDGEFVTDRNKMLSIDLETQYLLGLFSPSHMRFNADRNKDSEPSLAEMTDTAIKVLKRNNPNGMLLVVEGGKIDLAHHYNNAFRALDDTLAFDEAVEVALRRLDLSETLIIVTSDHASAVSYSGFATPKEYSVLGMDKYISNVDKRPYQLLTYSSGLGHINYNETAAMRDQRNSYHQATIASTWSNHDGTDVPLYAVGLLSNILFGGSLDQTYIPHAIAFAMCLFDYQDRCYSQPIERKIPPKISKFHQLKKKLQKELFKDQLNELDNLEEISTNYANNTEFDLSLTSDLISNSTDGEASGASGKHKIFSSLSLLLTLFVLLFLL